MDPYLEAHSLWSGLHLQLINDIVEDLQPQSVPRYVARPDQTVVIGSAYETAGPDVLVHEGTEEGEGGGTLVAVRPATAEVAIPEFIEAPELMTPQRFVRIIDPETRDVITVIEIPSPWNKVGRGRERYRRKQDRLLLSDTNLVEIDLLRRGPHVIAAPADRVRPADYRVCIHRAGLCGFGLVRFGVRDPLPNIGIPLRPDDDDVILHLCAVFSRAYDAGGYAYIVRYSQEPDPPLSAEDSLWARGLLAG